MYVWCSQVSTADGIVPLRGYPLGHFMETVVQGRLLGVMTIYYLRDKDPMWLETINRMVDRVSELMIDKGDYCYLPTRIFEPGAKVPPEAGKPVHMAAEELGGRFIQGLAQYYRVSGYEPARRLNEKLVNYLRYHSQYFDEQGRFVQWDRDGKPFVEGGHFHAHALGLLNMLEHAMAVDDRELINYVKRGYEWAKTNTYSSLELGWFPEIVRSEHTWSEPCCFADMVALGVKLTRAGAGDYWDDVDRWTRNQLVETQTAGGGYGPGCCTGNATRALYYAWKGILDCDEGRLRVNLLMNRASKWADVDSAIPYEGRVDVRIKQPCEQVSIRAPEWIETGSETFVCEVNGTPRRVQWNGRYVNASRGSPGDVFSFMFPISERTVSNVQLGEVNHTLVIKGNDVVAIEPRGAHPYMPLYERDRYRENQARRRKLRRFAPERELEW